MDIDDGFWRGYAFNNATHTWKSFAGQLISGHAMLVVGYDDTKHALLVMNFMGINMESGSQ